MSSRFTIDEFLNAIWSCGSDRSPRLRQGNPLSHFLFIIVMEGLHLAIEDAVNQGLFRGARVREDGFSLSYLFYADDQNISNLFTILNCFIWSRALDLIYKSLIYMVFVLLMLKWRLWLWVLGVLMLKWRLWVLGIGCMAASILFYYLGLPVGVKMTRINKWDMVVSKFKKRLSNRKANLLLVCGRLTPIKSVLNSLGI
uniref:Reverse transcriptase domain-containing protein n=1 Tax=Lactuca sativa TaxID=4236 RepID=A0A9R1XXE6_LACSA|nr:hypothetical protein LSAT_V11C100032000 [Lactuca sativa]